MQLPHQCPAGRIEVGREEILVVAEGDGRGDGRNVGRGQLVAITRAEYDASSRADEREECVQIMDAGCGGESESKPEFHVGGLAGG